MHVPQEPQPHLVGATRCTYEVRLGLKHVNKGVKHYVIPDIGEKIPASEI